MFDELIERVKAYYELRGLKWPQPKDSAIFLSCESSELLDCVMRCESEWVRNNPKSPDLEGEVADVLMMLLVTSYGLGIDPVEALLAKMERKLREQYQRQNNS